ncbi:hypothetical protein FRC06_010371, partial [Ceratobasidium sp. 370]
RPPSRPSTPSARKSNLKPKKLHCGKRGNRPGIIVQPDTWTTSNASSPEPFPAPGPQVGDTLMASQGRTRNELEASNRAEAIRCTTSFLGVETSRLPARTIQKLLAKISNQGEDIEETQTGPMGHEGGSALAVLQSAHQLVLASRHQSYAAGVTDDVDFPQDSDTPPTGLIGLRAWHLELPPNDDTAMESESEPESVELGPGDSISQRLPSATLPSCTILAPSRHSPTPTPHAPYHACRTRRSHNPHIDSDTATIDETSDSGSPRPDTETVWLHKQQWLTQDSQDPYVEATRSSAHTSPVPPTPPAATNQAPATSAVASSSMPTGVLNQPPTSDLKAILARAAQLVKQANCSHMTTGQGGGAPHQASQASEPRNVYDKLAEALDNLQCSQLKKAQQPPTHPWHTNFVEDNTVLLDAEAALALGKHVHSHCKPTLSDFPGLPWRIATLAIPDLVAVAVTQGAYETFGTACDWAVECYNKVWRHELPESPQKAPHALQAIKLCTDVNQYEHPALERCIAAAFFSGPESVGIPIPIPAVAMVLTTMQHCISEWSTGRFVSKELNAGLQLKMYESHLTGLLQYTKSTPKRLLDFRGKWFWFGVDYAGPRPEDEPYQAITQADQVRPDTPIPNTTGETHGRSTKVVCGVRLDGLTAAEKLAKIHTLTSEETFEIHYEHIDAGKGSGRKFSNPCMVEILLQVMFKGGSSSDGAHWFHCFNPISSNLLALLIVSLIVALREHTFGNMRKNVSFTDSAFRPVFLGIKHTIDSYKEQRGVRFREITDAILNSCRLAAGLTDDEEPMYNLLLSP